jgi:uncharacterized protein
MRLAIAAAALVAVLPGRARAEGDQSVPPTPAPKADAGPAAPPKAEPAPKAGGGAPAPAEPAPKAGLRSQGGAKAEAAAKPPTAANDLARALLTKEQWGKVLDSYAQSLSGQISQALLSTGEKVPDDLRSKLRGELDKALPYQQTVDAQAAALAQQLTADELKKTATFYASPLGRKVLDRLPEAQSAVAQHLQARLATAVPEIVNRLAPKAMSGSPHGAPGAAPGGGAGSSGGGGAGAGSSGGAGASGGGGAQKPDGGAGPK